MLFEQQGGLTAIDLFLFITIYYYLLLISCLVHKERLFSTYWANWGLLKASLFFVSLMISKCLEPTFLSLVFPLYLTTRNVILLAPCSRCQLHCEQTSPTWLPVLLSTLLQTNWKLRFTMISFHCTLLMLPPALNSLHRIEGKLALCNSHNYSIEICYKPGSQLQVYYEYLAIYMNSDMRTPFLTCCNYLCPCNLYWYKLSTGWH